MALFKRGFFWSEVTLYTRTVPLKSSNHLLGQVFWNVALFEYQRQRVFSSEAVGRTLRDKGGTYRMAYGEAARQVFGDEIVTKFASAAASDANHHLTSMDFLAAAFSAAHFVRLTGQTAW